eukprot:3948522-Alexandrium_andersonii.AAC.1
MRRTAARAFMAWHCPRQLSFVCGRPRRRHIMHQAASRRRPARLSCPRQVCVASAAPGGAAPRAWGGAGPAPA